MTKKKRKKNPIIRALYWASSLNNDVSNFERKASLILKEKPAKKSQHLISYIVTIFVYLLKISSNLHLQSTI